MKKIFLEAKTIGIVVKDNSNIDQVSTALALFLLFKKQGKEVYYKTNKILSLLPEINDKKNKIILSVKKDISEIYYEKIGTIINLYLTPKINQISTEDFKCTLARASDNICCEKLFAIGFKDFNDLEEEAATDFSNLYHAEIINIDNNELNKRFGKYNFIEEKSSISKITFENMDFELLEKDIASILLTGIYEGEIGTIEKLIEKGAKLESIYKIMNLIKVIENMNTFKDLYYSSLNKFEKEDISFILQFLKNYLQVSNFMLLLNKDTLVFYFKNEEHLEKMKVLNAIIKNQGGILIKENLKLEKILNTL